MIKLEKNKAKSILHILTSNVQTYDVRFKRYTTTQVPLYYDAGAHILFNDGFLDNYEVQNVVDVEIPKYEVDFKVPNFNIQPRDYQIQACHKALDRPYRLLTMATGSGKSLTITMILNHFYEKGYKGLLVVPNINLLKQFKNDIIDYTNSTEYQHLADVNICGNGEVNFSFDKYLTITTWQTLAKHSIRNVDFVIVDEVHKLSSKVSNELLSFLETKHLIGFTGTVPDKEPNKGRLFGMFGNPVNIIDTKQLLLNKQGTSINVNKVELDYDDEFIDNIQFLRNNYQTLVNTISSYKPRINFITDLAKKLKEKDNGSVLILYTNTENGLEYYERLSTVFNNEHDPYINNEDKQVFFMNSKTKANDRELIRKLLDNGSRILVANYALMSTGVNIKSLRYLILAQPLRSKVTITQSIGRGIRLCTGKTRFDVFDIVDNLTDAKINTFQNSFNSRLSSVYQDVAKLTRTKYFLKK